MLKTPKLAFIIWPSLATENGRAWRYSLKLFLWQRLALTLAGLVAALFFKPDNTPHIFLLPAQVFAPTSGWQYFFTSPWQRWDTEEYLAIESGGYGLHPALSNFPPLYPVLVGLVGRVLLNHFLLAALLVSNLAFVGALYFLYRLTAHTWDDKAARYSCLALVCFPTAHFFLLGYSESLFLLLVTATFYYIAKNQWWCGCFLAVLAVLTRLQGIVLVLPLAYFYWQQHRSKSAEKTRFWTIPFDLKILGLLFGPLALVLFELYIHFTVPTADELGGLSRFWNIKITWPGDTLLTALWKMVQPDTLYISLYNFWGLFLLALISLTLWRGRHSLLVSYQLYAWASILLYLTRKGEIITTVSLERYLVLIFPAFMYVGLLLSRKQGFYRRRLLLLSVGFLLQWSMAFGFPFWFWTG